MDSEWCDKGRGRGAPASPGELRGARASQWSRGGRRDGAHALGERRQSVCTQGREEGRGRSERQRPQAPGLELDFLADGRGALEDTRALEKHPQLRALGQCCAAGHTAWAPLGEGRGGEPSAARSLQRWRGRHRQAEMLPPRPTGPALLRHTWRSWAPPQLPLRVVQTWLENKPIPPS